MATASPLILTAVNLGEDFSETITIVPDMLEIISSVSTSLSGSPVEPNITIVSNTTSVTISGKHLNTFTDVFTYLEPGQSELTVEPTIVVGIGNMPPDKNLFDLNQDLRKSETRTYNILINGSSTITVTQEVLNPLETIRSFMDNYNYKAR